MKKIITLILSVFSFFTVQAQIQSLTKLSQISFNTSCAGVWHYADSAGNEYALLGNGDGLVIVDVTDPVNPAVLFTVPAANSLWREVKTYGHYAYAGTEGGGGITVIDLSGLPASYQSQVYTGDGAIAGLLGSSHTVQVFDDHLYIFGSNIGTVICSLNDPWNPQYVGTYDDNYVHDGYVLNDTLYSSEIYAGQFSVVDVTDKANPVVLQTQPTPGAFNHNGWFSDNRQYFFTTDELPNTPVGVFDVSDIQDIKLVATYVNDTMPGEEVHNTRVFNDYILCPSYGSQLTIVDAARPENLIEIARYQTGSYLCWDASPYLPSGNIIATDMDGEFYVFAPYYVRACYLEGNVTDLITGNPINGVTVKLLSTTKEVSSNTIGDYKTGYPTAGTFDVEFSRPGYLTKIETGVALTTGNLTILDVQLEPFSVTVNVVDNSTGAPIPFANVKVQNATTDVDLTTDVNGSVLLASITASTYEITAALWGYYSGCITVAVGAGGTYTIALDPGLYDDFTFDNNWVTFSTASSGGWVREEPIGTLFSSNQANPEVDVTNDCSDRCFITGNGGGTANTDDVDDGTVTLTSPTLDLTGYTDPYLNYERWFYEAFSGNPAANDTMFVSIRSGGNITVVDVITGPSATNSSWVSNSLRILDFTTLSTNMNVIVSVSDKLGTGNPLEAGFDRFEITEGPTSVSELTNNVNGMMVYPNPFTDVVEIKITDTNFTGDAELVITDISGREISRSHVSTLNKIAVSTETWSRGVYILKLSNGTSTLTPQKITKL
jgi:choice-of-anchor B domain-containing protein